MGNPPLFQPEAARGHSFQLKTNKKAAAIQIGLLQP